MAKRASFSKQDTNRQLIYQKNKCGFCRSDFDINITVSKNADHKIPPQKFDAYLSVSEEETKKQFLLNDVRADAKIDNDTSNLMILCAQCNNNKSDATYYEYIKRNKDFFELFGWKFIENESPKSPSYDDENAKWTHEQWNEYKRIPLENFLNKFPDIKNKI